MTEEGARELGLQLRERDTRSLTTFVGVRVTGEIDYFARGIVLHPELELEWNREWITGERSLEGTLAGGGLAAFQLDAAQADADAFRASLGAGTLLLPGVWVSLGIDVELGRSDGSAQQVRLGLQTAF